MVNRLLGVMLAAVSLSAPAATSAQSVDWARAGGDLFGRPPAADIPGGEPGALAEARLAPLSQPYMAAVAQAAERHGLDPKLLHALVVVESGYQPGVCSPAGACGLTQLMPGTAADLGVRDRLDPADNLDGGADYLARQILTFGDLRLALAAFNAGPWRVRQLGRIPDIRETRDYVFRVVDCYLALSAGKGVRSARECRPAGGVS